MKTKLPLLILCVALLLSCGGGSTQSSNKGSKATETTQAPKTLRLDNVLPTPTSKSVDIGLISIDANGASIGSVTEMTTLRDLLKDDVDIINISWTADYNPPYSDIPMRLTYNKGIGKLVISYRSSGVEEVYSNVSVDALNAFINANEGSFYSLEKYSKDVRYTFNNELPDPVGKKPTQSEIDGSVSEVVSFIKANADGDVKFSNWSKVNSNGAYWVVRCKIEGDNAFGINSAEYIWFYIQDGDVKQVKGDSGVVYSK